MSTDELACTYASLILHDEKIPITAEKIEAIVAAAGVTVQPFWPGLFSKVLVNKDLDDLILNAGGGAAPAGGAAAPGATGSSGGSAEPEPEPEPEEEEESDDDMGFSLFD